MSRLEHPASPSEVTPEWLTRALQTARLLNDARVAGVHTEIIGEERGFTGVIARIEVVYDGPVSDAPETIVAKFPLAERDIDSSYRRAQLHSSAIPPKMMERARREVEFYNFAGGTLTGLPRCYLSHVDLDSGRAFMLLEDLSSGCPGDALLGCTVDEARSVLNTIARVHARWWRDNALSEHSWLGNWSDANQQRAERFRGQAEIVTEAFAARLPPPVIDVIHKSVDSFGGLLADLANAPIALIHADLHLDNIIFMPDGEGVAATLIDWQGPSRGPAVLDIAGFVAEALTIEERRKHEINLLRSYHDELSKSATDDYCFIQLYEDYRRALTVRAAGQVGWLARVIEHPPTGRERALVDALFDPGRVFAALLDHHG